MSLYMREQIYYQAYLSINNQAFKYGTSTDEFHVKNITVFSRCTPCLMPSKRVGAKTKSQLHDSRDKAQFHNQLTAHLLEHCRAAEQIQGSQVLLPLYLPRDNASG